MLTPAGGGAGQIKPECDFLGLVTLWPAAVSLKPCFLGNINSSVLNSLQTLTHAEEVRLSTSCQHQGARLPSEAHQEVTQLILMVSSGETSARRTNLGHFQIPEPRLPERG